MANSSIYAAFERMWQHIVALVGTKASIDHNHNDEYYTETEVDNLLGNMELVTIDDIDAVCSKDDVEYAKDMIL